MQSSYDASFMVLESSSTLNTLEIQIASAVPELLSSVDDQLASYWKRWNSLLFLLENTVKARVSRALNFLLFLLIIMIFLLNMKFSRSICFLYKVL